MQKFSDSSRMKSQKLMKTSLKRNVKKISIGAVLLAVGFSSYAVIASDDSMVSSKGKGVSIAAAGNTLYADNIADYGEATSSVALADGTLSDVNKTGSVALSSKKTVKKTSAISGGVQESTTEARATEAAQQAAEKELLASLIFCEAGNQPYEGQVAVGAVVMNRIKSSSYPDTMEEVIYQSGQFSPAMSGWLDRVRANQGYTEVAMQAAEDALALQSQL